MRVLSILCLATMACAPAPTPGQAQLPALLAYDFDDRVRRFDLPGRLDEISGLSFSPDGRLFAHDDERGRVHEIDPMTGEVGKRWDLGDPMIRGDFEGLSIVGERFFLITSGGLLYEFREAEHDESVEFRVTDTGVGARCEVEGLDYDPLGDALLIACKVVTPDRGDIVVHQLPLDGARGRPAPLRIQKSGLAAFGLPTKFEASAVAAHTSGTIFLLSGPNDALIEVDREGHILGAVPLSGGRHPQAEGLDIGRDETLYISDEKNGKEPRLTAYGLANPGGAR